LKSSPQNSLSKSSKSWRNGILQKQDILELVEQLQEVPTIGTPLGNDCFKIRIRITGKNKGKSGGGRVITCVKITNEMVVLLAIYDKSELDNITDKDLEDRIAAFFDEG